MPERLITGLSLATTKILRYPYNLAGLERGGADIIAPPNMLPAGTPRMRQQPNRNDDTSMLLIDASPLHYRTRRKKLVRYAIHTETMEPGPFRIRWADLHTFPDQVSGPLHPTHGRYQPHADRYPKNMHATMPIVLSPTFK